MKTTTTQTGTKAETRRTQSPAEILFQHFLGVSLRPLCLCVCLWLVTVTPAFAATNDLSGLLQKGLLEEEANRNLDAAAQAYQAVSTQFDKDRALAATAIFRLGEIYRKQNKTNQAAAQYERIVREFADQDTLATLSRQNLAGLQASPRAPLATSAGETELNTEAQLLARLKTLSQPELREVLPGIANDQVLSALIQQLNAADLQFASRGRDITESHPEFERIIATQKLLNEKIDARVLSILKAMEIRVSANQRAKSGTKPAANPEPTITTVLDAEEAEIRRIQEMIRNSPDLINAPSGDPSMTPLCRAARSGQLRVAKFLLDGNAAIERRSNDRTPLMYAAMGGHRAMIELLLQRGADVNARNSSGRTALHNAADSGFQAVAEALIAAKADLDAVTANQETPLLLATGKGHTDLVRFLISKGAKLDIPNSGEVTPVILAAQQGKSETLTALLGAKADPNRQDKEGRTALSYAAGYGHLDSVKALLAAKADPNAGRLNLPLSMAIRARNTAIIEALLRAGADANRVADLRYINANGGTTAFACNPLYLAVSENNPEAVQLLLQFKADPNGVSPNKEPMIFSAVEKSPILEALLEAGANPNARDAEGSTVLIRAVGYDDSVKLLLDRGAEVNARDKWQSTALHRAVDTSTVKSVELLLAAKAEVNARNSFNSTPLHRAVTPDRLQLMELLLANGADPNLRDNSGQTPLDYTKPKTGFGMPAPVPGRIPPPMRAEPAPKPEDLADVLRKHGALEDLPKLDRIEVRRGGYSAVVFWKGTNDWNQFTLLELIGVEYGILAMQRDATRYGFTSETPLPWRMKNERGQPSTLSFPDLTHIIIQRPSPDGKSRKAMSVDANAILNSGDCTKDVTLNWGDVVEIPEQDHPINEAWGGFSIEALNTLQKCLARKITISVKDQTLPLTLSPGIGVEDGKLLSLISNRPFTLLKVLDESKVLRSSSDLSRVKVTRRSPASGRPQTWIVDCSGNRFPDLWLREGDVIEVPDKL